MLRTWVEEWDERIANWIKQGPTSDMGLSHVLNSYKGKGLECFKLQLNAMPEPYVGDPLSSEELDFVLLTLNPGGSGQEQCFPNGCLVTQVQNSTYYDAAKKYLHKNTKKWWERRSKWPARLLEVSKDKYRIIGIDLIPWHSTKWGGVELNSPDVLQWFKNNVHRPAALMAERSRLSNHYGIGYPLVLALGSHHATCLKELNFTSKINVNQNNEEYNSVWPVRHDGQRVKRNFRLFVSEDPLLAVLQTEFIPPSKEFDNIVKKLLKQSI